MYHPFRKDSTWLRQALLDVYQGKCVYCGTLLQPRYMQVDHIIPTNPEPLQDDDIIKYMEELVQDGFVHDSIENYLPSCSACNDRKNNHLYPAASLRYYHELAKRNLDKVLARIAKLKEKGTESFFEPLDAKIWEELTFDYQRDISYAIMGYRLTHTDVVACPRFPQVERIKKQLGIVDYVWLQGESGCGKSISIYQAAYDFHQKGWSVYRFRGQEELQSLHLSSNTTPSLYIVDDAQLLSAQILEVLTEQARPNAKVILARTVSSAMGHDIILLTNQDAVQQLYEDFLQRRTDIIPIVQQVDRQIGISPSSTLIEWRLNDARKASTPWQFNYILRGGWQSMGERYQTICNHHNCDLLAAAIAVFQIVNLDQSMDFDLLCAQLKSFNSRLCWNQNDLNYLVNQQIVLSNDDVRIVHMESANVIIAQFLSRGSKEKQETLYKVVENAFLEGLFSKLGLVWLCNGLLRYCVFPFARDRFISEDMVTFALGKLSVSQTPKERRDTAFFLEKVFDMKFTHNGRYYLDTQETIWVDWISHASSENAYAYSLLLNTLYNEDKEAYARFTDKVDWILLMETLCHEAHANLYAWSKLIDRLAIRNASNSQKAALETAIRNIRSSISTNNILGFTDLLSCTGHLVPFCVHETVSLLAPVYKSYFLQNTKQSLEIFDFHFFLTICGINLLGGHRSTQAEKDSAAIIVAALPEVELATIISDSLPRDWQRIYEVLFLISKYDREKAKRIILAIDLNQLSMRAKDAWTDDHDIDCLCVALYLGSPSIARRFIEMNKAKITTVYSVFVWIAPKCASALFHKGIPLDLIKNYRWDMSVCALRALLKVDALAAKATLSDSCTEIVKQLNQLSVHDLEDDSCVQFLQLIQQYAPDIWKDITTRIDSRNLTLFWDNYSTGYSRTKRVKKRIQKLIEMFETE